MGNNSSQSKFIEVKAKLEDYDNIPDIYRIIDPKGGGELVDLSWAAHQLRDVTQIDSYIKREVSKYILNDGKGDLVYSPYIKIIQPVPSNRSNHFSKISVNEIIQHRNTDAFYNKKKVVKKPNIGIFSNFILVSVKRS